MNRKATLILTVIFCITGLKSFAQDPYFSAGIDVAYNLSQYRYHEKSYSHWYVDGWTGNFSPALTLRYGNKLAGVFRTVYIFNEFEEETYGSSGGSKTYYDLHQIYFDFLFHTTLKGSSGMFLQFGYGAGIPIRNRYTNSSGEEEFIKPDYFADLQILVGYGAYIPVNEKNVFRIESNLRLGLYKIPVQGENSWDDGPGRARTFELQFIIGYLRHFKK